MSSDSASSHSPPPLIVDFILTGFGPFNGIPSNPSSHIIRHLPSYLLSHPFPHPHMTLSSSSSLTVLEVSAISCLQYLALMRRPHISAQYIPIHIHLGVASSIKNFHLEKFGYNESTFRVKDERGWSPNNIKIIPNGPPCLSTQIPTDKLCESLKSISHDVEESDNPGRFVCNFLYFSSLFQSYQQKYLSLFVHIPTLDTIGEEKQIAFLRDLMIHIDGMVRNDVIRKDIMENKMVLGEKEVRWERGMEEGTLKTEDLYIKEHHHSHGHGHLSQNHSSTSSSSVSLSSPSSLVSSDSEEKEKFKPFGKG